MGVVISRDGRMVVAAVCDRDAEPAGATDSGSRDAGAGGRLT